MASPKTHDPSAAMTALPVLQAGSWSSPLSDHVLSRISELLPDLVRTRRWFRAKAKTIVSIQVTDVVPFPESESWLLVLDFHYQAGDSESYLLPLSLAAEQEEVFSAEPLAILEVEGHERLLYSALANPKFRDALLSAVANSRSYKGRVGEFLARATELPPGMTVNLNVQLDSSVSRAEQSNSSIIFGDQFIAKLFRKVEPGINPDIEIGTFLTEHAFANTPAVLGTFEYRGPRGAYAVGILQSFVRNQGDAWDYTLESLGSFFERALSRKEGPHPISNEHPLLFAQRQVPQDVRELLGEYLDYAVLLGKRTAEMHQVLASDKNIPDFAPEPFTQSEGQKLYAEMLKQSDAAFDVLRQKQSSITGPGAESAAQLLMLEDQVKERFSPLRERDITAERIRFHGDYHLGQVLFTGKDFMIIDFEGEPARPLSERREKAFALRDVAGMVRSFQYAAYAALFGQVPGVSVKSEKPEEIEAWSAFWNDWISAAYLRGYFEAAGSASIVPPTQDERQLLLDAFLLHKALYEVAYELNNRPDWVRIPVRGILSLIQ